MATLRIDLASHGFSEGEQITLVSSIGMEAIVGQNFTTADVTTDSFVLKSEDGTAYFDPETVEYTEPITFVFREVSGTASSLSHLEGQTVGAVGDGKNFGEYTVSGGEVDLEDKWYNKLVIGLPYTTTISPLPIEPQMTQVFPYGSRKQVVEAILKFKDTKGGSVGTDLNNMEDVTFRTLDDPIGIQIGEQNTDVQKYFRDKWETVKRFYIQQSLPFPLEVLSISLKTDIKGR